MSDPTSPAAPARPATSRDYLFAVLACALTTAISLPLRTWLEPVNAVMLFLLTVALIATRLQRGPAVLASFLSVALFDFFHVPPRWSFAVSDVQYLLTFAVMLVVTLIISQLTISLRLRAQEAQRTAGRSHALYELASRLAGALTIEQVCDATSRFTRDELDAQTRLMVADTTPGALPGALRPATDPQPPLTSTLALLVQAVHLGHDHHGTQHRDDTDAVETVLPLAGSTRSRGVLILSTPPGQPGLAESQRPMLEALATLVATSLERLHFVQVAHQTQLEINDERLRGSILSALSHDIRTPLTSLYGLADALTLMDLPQRARSMATDIRDQAMRLHRMVSNLLDMARLKRDHDNGTVSLRREWQPIDEVIGASIQMLGQALAHHPVRIDLPPDLPLVWIDAVLMERVLANLLENAAKYAPAHTAIDLRVGLDGERVVVSLHNEGSGFPTDRLAHIFGVFERGHSESSIPGVGLGLSICQAIVQAHGGQIDAFNPPEGGATVRFTLPRGNPPHVDLDGPEAQP